MNGFGVELQSTSVGGSGCTIDAVQQSEEWHEGRVQTVHAP